MIFAEIMQQLCNNHAASFNNLLQAHTMTLPILAFGLFLFAINRGQVACLSDPAHTQ